MPLMLPPALVKIAAEARAMKAIRSVYSMRSCPCSSTRKRCKVFINPLCGTPYSLAIPQVVIREPLTDADSSAAQDFHGVGAADPDQLGAEFAIRPHLRWHIENYGKVPRGFEPQSDLR